MASDKGYPVIHAAIALASRLGAASHNRDLDNYL
jgi:hypothetical protein